MITNNFDIFYGGKNAYVEEGNDEWNIIKMMMNEKNLENELDEQQANVQDSYSDEEDDHVKATSASFKNLIKNELGFDVSLESVSGFKVSVFKL
jgi:regulation of enolase protein 1 (concanavalin A-like superfamily)